MNILFLNNYYYIRGGSERVFFGEMDLLRGHGHMISGFARRHPMDQPAEYARFFPPPIVTDRLRLSWSAIKTASEIFYSAGVRRSLAKVLEHFRPDVAHLHNIYGRLTTAVLDLLAIHRIPVVMTLHDYKLACPSYLFLSGGQVCEACKGGHYYRALLRRCHKRSYAASAAAALESYLNDWSGKYRRKVALFISPSRFLKEKLAEFGWPEQKVRHVANFLNAADFEPTYAPGRYLLYFGRLSAEKGIASLIQAYRGLQAPAVELVIAGDGPMRTELETLAQGSPAIRFTGYLEGKVLREVIRNALAVVVPSLCYENAPLSVLEAMACGKPVIGARIGGIPELVQEKVTGRLFTSGDVQDLKDTLEAMISLPVPAVAAMGLSARKAVESEYSPDAHYRQLSEVYHAVLRGSPCISRM